MLWSTTVAGTGSSDRFKRPVQSTVIITWEPRLAVLGFNEYCVFKYWETDWENARMCLFFCFICKHDKTLTTITPISNRSGKRSKSLAEALSPLLLSLQFFFVWLSHFPDSLDSTIFVHRIGRVVRHPVYIGPNRPVERRRSPRTVGVLSVRAFVDYSLLKNITQNIATSLVREIR